MLIEIHIIQNHAAANLNRDDLGAPKTCWFGGVLRSRISSQCLKRSIRMSDKFANLRGGIRTRRLAQVVAEEIIGKKAKDITDAKEKKEYEDAQKRAENVFALCGFPAKAPDKKKDTKTDNEKDEEEDAKDVKSAALVFTTQEAKREMAELLGGRKLIDIDLAVAFAELIATKTAVPDMALFGRMLEPKTDVKGVSKEEKEKINKAWKELKRNVEAALQVAHAVSTHEARPEVDYYVAADDTPGPDAGAGYVDEAMFASACFYKYFSLNWDQLVKNLKGFGDGYEDLAAYTLGALIRAAALVTPTGKQNSFAAHNPPDGILLEVKEKNTPLSYANAFADPAAPAKDRGLIAQSIAQLGQYVHDLDGGYGKPRFRFWFSPNLRYPLGVVQDKKEVPVTEENVKSLDEIVAGVVNAVGHDWTAVQKKFAEIKW
jgi:CRISPR system Cascade subunit CasC